MKNEEKALSEREKILGRIREALTVSAPRPRSQGDLSVQASAEPSANHAREWLPLVGASVAEQFSLFAKTPPI